MQSKRKIIIATVVMIAVLISVITVRIIIWNNNIQRKVKTAEIYAVKALQQNYKKDFVIKYGKYIGATGGYEFQVYPKDNPDFIFNAWLNGMTESGESDDYLLCLHNLQGKQMIEPYIKNIAMDYYIDSSASGPVPGVSGFKDILRNINTKMMSVEEYIKAYPNKIEFNSNIYLNYDMTNGDRKNIYKKIFKLLEYIKSKNMGSMNINFFFMNLPNKNINELGQKDINFSTDYYDFIQSNIYVNKKILNTINNYYDIKKYFTKIRD